MEGAAAGGDAAEADGPGGAAGAASRRSRTRSPPFSISTSVRPYSRNRSRSPRSSLRFMRRPSRSGIRLSDALDVGTGAGVDLEDVTLVDEQRDRDDPPG